MQSWLKNTSIYSDPRILRIFFLGFSSGLPFLLTLATLHAWLTEVGVNKTTIGLFVLVTVPYSLKFIWAPFVDHFKIPFFCTLLGRRKGWMLISQLCLICSLIFLGSTHPEENIFITALAAFLVAFFSATQDIVVEAFRVESLEAAHMGHGAGASNLGYRLGMWVSGAGALYLASNFSWFMVYSFMAACVIAGLITTLLSPESSLDHDASKVYAQELSHEDFWKGLRREFLTSFRTMIHRKDLTIILLFIFFYKIGDTVLNTMSMPFLLETGYTKIEIAHVAKSFGISAMIIGGVFGGIYLSRGFMTGTLIAAALLHIFASLMFWLQASIGHHLGMLFLTIGIENLASGLGSAAFIVYLSSRCLAPHTATHFALLTSFGSFCRVSLSSIAGWTADHLAWADFYSLTAILCVPCLLLIIARAASFRFSFDDALSVPNRKRATV